LPLPTAEIRRGRHWRYRLRDNATAALRATKALQDADFDPSIGALVFSGAGGMFTAGNDLADFLEADSTPGELPAFTFIKALAQCETPLVAAMEGIAIGIGATLMLHSCTPVAQRELSRE
jgi:enoyl-CoA hydratase/carnithine racemase